jgi:DNA-binding transcriptional LysR family regulator
MMQAMDLKDIDLNLLVVFNQLRIQGRVSRVAETLGVTQPAVSNALARLRAVLGDELFLRTPRGMEPTPFAEQLAEPVAAALGMLESAVSQRSSFAPATSQRAFTIAMTDIGDIYFLPALMESLSKIAPGVSVSTVRNTAAGLKEEMEAGKVDLAVGLLPQLKAGFFQRRLFRQRYVCLLRKGHRLSRRAMRLEDFSAAEHVVVTSPGTGHGRIEELLERAGVQRHVRLQVPHFVAVGHILQTTDLLATVPEAFAQRVAEPFGLTYFAHPAALPDIAINLFWHAKNHKDPANQWLRGLMMELFTA